MSTRKTVDDRRANERFRHRGQQLGPDLVTQHYSKAQSLTENQNAHE